MMKGYLTGVLLLLGGCATYHAAPLTAATPRPTSLAMLTLPVAGQARHTQRVDPGDGLNLTEVASLAALNSPQLKSARAQAGVAEAQLFAAGLLPDPQFSWSLDHPTSQGASLMNGLALGMGYSLTSLLTRPARREAARQHVGSVRLDLLWQEWQTINQAQTLAVNLQFEQRQLAVVDAMLARYRTRYGLSSEALRQGNVTLGPTGSDLAMLLNALSQQNQLKQALNRDRHQLTLLLGLAPDVEIPLSPLPPRPEADDATLAEQRRELPRRRPDLLALQAGYASQEAQLRAAILGQFPGLSVSLNRARDTGGVLTNGLDVGLNLPLFDGNRGAIAVARATRAQLQANYQARLAEADTQISELLAQDQLLGTQASLLRQYLPALGSFVTGSADAFTRGDMDTLTYLNMESTYTSKQLEALSVEQQQWQIRIALQALLGQMSTAQERVQ